MSNRLYVGNLSFHSTDDTIRNAFAGCGNVTDVHVVTDRVTGRSRGFAFVTMETDDQARRAIETMNGIALDGRNLRVSEAEQRSSRGGGGGGPSFGGPREGGGGGGRGGRGDHRGGGGGGRERW